MARLAGLILLSLWMGGFGLPAQTAAPRKQRPPVNAAKPKPAPGAAGLKKKEEPARFPVELVRSTGSKLYPESAILAVAALRVGEPLEEKKIETSRDNLLAHGAFSNVSYRYDPAPSQKGYVVTFEVTDFEQLFPFRFERLEADDAKLRAYLKQKEPLFGEKIPGAENILARFRALLSEYLKAENKPAEVQARLVAEGGDTYVMFSPPGQLPAVATVTFTGNKVLPLTVLQNTIHPVAVGTPYRESRFRELLDASIRPLYEARGRLKVKFTAIKAEPSTSVKGLAITVGVEEGESYSFGNVSVAGAPGLEDELIKAAAISSGGVADYQAATDAQERIHRVFRRLGHMTVASTVERKLRETDRFCDLVYRVTPGPRFNFGRLFLQGLDLHGEHEMKRIWTMKPGAPYNADYPELFLTRVKEDQLFDDLQNVRAIPLVNQATLTVDVRLVFNEKRAKPVL